MLKKNQIINEIKTIPEQYIESRILIIRGRRVMLDKDLAALYGVATGQLKRAVNRNIERFPGDFLIIANKEEADALRCQFGISKKGRGGERYLPYLFTEQGVAMLSSVLKTKRAIQVNIQIMRVFTRIREFMISHKEFAQKIESIEKKFKEHDKNFIIIFKAIRELLKKGSFLIKLIQIELTQIIANQTPMVADLRCRQDIRDYLCAIRDD